MPKLSTIGEIKEIAQMLDTATVQWMSSGPPTEIQSRLQEARELLHHGLELVDSSLKIAIVGEFNGGKTLLLNALLDSAELFPSLFQPTTGNVLEVRITLRRDERAPDVRSAQVFFCNQDEIDGILDQFLKDLKAQGVEGLPAKIDQTDLDKFERFLCKQYTEARAVTAKYAIAAALDYICALHANQDLVCREERVVANLPVDLVSSALTLPPRPDLNKGIQGVYEFMKRSYEAKGTKAVDKLTSTNIRTIFPMIRRVVVEMTAWATPFGLKDSDSGKKIAFLDFPGIGSDTSTARDHHLCISEIQNAHAILVVFNGANPGGSGASFMATLFQKAGKLSSERTLVAVNRFDEFHPMPQERNATQYYRKEEDGTTVGFCNVLVPAKNLLSSIKNFHLYITSAMVYFFEERANRPNWNFGNPNWFNENKRQGCAALYKRCVPDFERLITEANQQKGQRELQILAQGLERYLDTAGIPCLRKDIVKFAMERGEKLILEDSLKEIRAAYRILDEIAPKFKGGAIERVAINPEVSIAAQDFYRVLELAVADTLPGGQSNYKRLRVKGMEEQDLSLWETIEQEIAANVTSWPEWFAILNQGPSKLGQRGSTPATAASAQPVKKFSRYQNIKKQTCNVPEEFQAFNERYRATAKLLTDLTIQGIGQAMVYSLQRFEQHSDYQDAIRNFQGMVMTEKLSSMEEAMPILDIWQPSQLAENDIVPIVLERINEEVVAIENLSYPYDGSKPCSWNLALIIRIQVQLLKTYRDRLSRLVAAAESQFQTFFCNEILRANILPLVRSALNNTEFLGNIAAAAPTTTNVGKTWESVGQVVRVAVETAKTRDGVPGAIDVSKLTQEGSEQETSNEPEEPQEEESENESEEPQEEEPPVNKNMRSPMTKPSVPSKPIVPPKPVASPVNKTPSPVKPAPVMAAKPATKPAPVETEEETPPLSPKDADVPTPPQYEPELLDDSDVPTPKPNAKPKGEKDDEEEFEEW